MARTLAQIKSEMTTAFMANETIAAAYGFEVGASFEDNFSLVSLEYFIFTITAYAILVMELLFGQHKKEVNDALLNQKSGREPWYRDMALRFQYGFDLAPEMDYYDNTGYDEQVVSASKIVKYAAVDEAVESSRVIIKIAGENNGILSPITEEQREAFDEYIRRIKWAGVKTTTINYLPDRLYLTLQIKRDPLVLNAQGMDILEGTTPVNDSLQAFVQNELDFNGELRLSALIDKLQVIPGVLDATLLNAQTSWIDPNVNGYSNPVPIVIAKKPVSGYFEIVTFDNISYVV